MKKKRSKDSQATAFENDLVDYFASYGALTATLVTRLREYDFSECKVRARLSIIVITLGCFSRVCSRKTYSGRIT